MRAHGLSATDALQVDCLTGGQSNPIFRVAAGSARYVLRKQPPSPLPPSAQAIDREYRAMAAVRETGVPSSAALKFLIAIGHSHTPGGPRHAAVRAIATFSCLAISAVPYESAVEYKRSANVGRTAVGPNQCRLVMLVDSVDRENALGEIDRDVHDAMDFPFRVS